MHTGNVKETANAYVDLDSSTGSDVEEVPIPSLRERVSARKLTVCSASKEQLMQTDISTVQSACESLQQPKPTSQYDRRTGVSISDDQHTSKTHRGLHTVMCSGVDTLCQCKLLNGSVGHAPYEDLVIIIH